MSNKEYPNAAANAQAARELDPRDRMILDFLHMHWNYQAAKEEEIRQQFDMNPVRFYQHVLTLLDDPMALAYAPMTVNRMRRQREERRGQRCRT